MAEREGDHEGRAAEPLALAITAFGIWIIIAPWPVPGPVPPM
jgi:hypothetical protein